MSNWKKETTALLFLLAMFFWPANKPNTIQAQHIPPQEGGIGVSITIEGITPSPTPPSQSGGGASIISIPATVVFKGYAYPEALITFVRNGVIIGNTLAKKDGSFEKEIGINSGISTFGTWVRDKFGFNSQTTDVSIALYGNTKTAITNIILSPTITANRSIFTQGEKLVIYGSATPKSTVRIFNNYSPGQTLPPVETGENGYWEYTLETLELQPGEYSLKANTQLETLGLLSPFSSNLIFNIKKRECYGSDFNNDGRINIKDFSILMFYWNKPLPQIKDRPVNSCVDIDNNGTVNLIDFSVMMYRWTG